MSTLQSRRQAADLWALAEELQSQGRYAEAAETFAVAADVIAEREAQGLATAEAAFDARANARLNLVAAWARQRWPTEGVLIEHVIPESPPLGMEVRHFLIQRSHREWTEVAVSRRGRVRVLPGRRRA